MICRITVNLSDYVDCRIGDVPSYVIPSISTFRGEAEHEPSILILILRRKVGRRIIREQSMSRIIKIVLCDNRWSP